MKTGIDCKVLDQITAFNDAGLNCDYLFCPQLESTIGKVVTSLPLAADGIRWPSDDEVRDLDYLYIRRPRFISRDLVRFLKRLKAANPKCTVFLEIPDFPYDDDMKVPFLFSAYLKDRHNRKKLTGLVDFLAIVGWDVPERVFGVPTIRISNGINLKRVPERVPALTPNRIDILFAAYTVIGEKRYATDRILEGLQKYYESGGSRDILLHMAVGGSGVPEIRNQIKRFGVEDHVRFYGALSNEELGTVANECGIGMATLGFHRVGITMSSAIKTRDYLARGLPFFYCGDIDLFMENPADFCLRIPADDSPVDMEAVIEFYDSLYDGKMPEEVAHRVRKYAVEHASMDATLSPVFSAIL